MKIVKDIIKIAVDKKIKIALAESCTGGLIAAAFTNIAGASKIFDCGFICYSNNAKTKMLGVKKTTLGKYGAVSPQVAKEMVLGAIKHSNANLALAITGIAGPEGGTKQKPVGLVYIAVCYGGKVKVQEYKFGKKTRSEIRKQSLQKSLELIYAEL